MSGAAAGGLSSTMHMFTVVAPAALMYAFQVMPDAIMAGLIVLSILLSNQSLTLLAVGTGLAQLLTGTVGRLLMRLSPDNAELNSSLNSCTGGFLGKSWDSLLGFNPDHLWHPRAPSPYMSMLGFLGGFGGAVQQLYKDEIDAGVYPRRTLIATAVLSILLVILAAVFRYLTGCETIMSIIGGLGMGVLLGYFGGIALGYSTSRRATNIWGIPLLRERINGGGPLYVCPAATN